MRRKRRQQWTGPELELAMRDDLTKKEIAAMLGRTIYAVNHIRQPVVDRPHVANG